MFKCGGILSDKWLDQAAPEIYSENNHMTPSQRKYLETILNWGTWQDFQALLHQLSSMAKTHGISLTNVATRWVLQQPSVGAVIVGTRLGVSDRTEENITVFSFRLSEVEMGKLNDAALGTNREKLEKVVAKLGDCGNEYRAMH